MFQPLEASNNAVAAPTPLLAPVIMATGFFEEFFIIYKLGFVDLAIALNIAT